MHRSNRTLLIATALSAATGLAHAAKVSETVVVDAAPDAVWKIVGDFGGLPGWHPAVAKVEIIKGSNNTPGAVRDITTKDNAKLVETLLAYNGKAHSMKYRIDQSPLPVAGYVSHFKVTPAGQGSRITWSSTFSVPAAARKDGVTDAKAKEIVAGMYTSGFDGIKAKLAGK